MRNHETVEENHERREPADTERHLVSPCELGPSVLGREQILRLDGNVANTRTNLEARVRIELTYKGFADLSLTTWVPRLDHAGKNGVEIDPSIPSFPHMQNAREGHWAVTASTHAQNTNFATPAQATRGVLILCWVSSPSGVSRTLRQRGSP
jgi:hypothetical protein